MLGGLQEVFAGGFEGCLCLGWLWKGGWEISEGKLREKWSKVQRELGKRNRQVVGVSGIIISVIWEGFKVLGDCSGCSEVLGKWWGGSVKKEVRSWEGSGAGSGAIEGGLW